MVRDFFPRDQAAQVLSRLFLLIAVSPLLAPTVGALVIRAAAWQAAFFALAAVEAGILGLVLALLPQGHTPDPDISLRPGPILREYGAILRALGGAVDRRIYAGMGLTVNRDELTAVQAILDALRGDQ